MSEEIESHCVEHQDKFKCCRAGWVVIQEMFLLIFTFTIVKCFFLCSLKCHLSEYLNMPN